MSLGSVLARVRLARGVQQKDLAASLSLARSTLSSWEADRRQPDADQLRELCRILHVSADVLLERAPFQLGPVPDDATLERNPSDQVADALARAGEVVPKRSG